MTVTDTFESVDCGKVHFTRMQAEDGEAVGEIFLFDDIGESFFGGVSSQMFAEALGELEAVSNIDLRINSMGGDVFEGMTIRSLMQSSGKTFNVKIDGMAASIASVIAVSGDTVEIADGGMVMIHNPWSIMAGEAEEFRAMAERLDKIRDIAVNVYHKETGARRAQLREWMSAETWFDSKEAVANGFADKVMEKQAVAAKFDPTRFKNAPQDWLQQQEIQTPIQEKVDPWRLRIAQRRLDLLELDG